MENNNALASAHKPIKVLDGVPMLIVCAIIVVALYVLGITGIFSSNLMRYLLKIFLYITLGEMWNLLSGFTGMTSLGQQAFIGMAGYTVAVFTTTLKMSFWIGILVGAGIAVVMALILSFILFRMRGMYFAIATWVVAEAICTWFKSWQFVGMGSGMSITAKPYPKTPEIYIMSLTLCVVAMIVVYVLLRTKTGLGLTAMRDDADAASAVGVNIFKSKLLVYVIAALFTALAGAIFFINKGTIYPDSGFDISWTVSMVFIVILGGVGTVSGPFLGAIIYVLLSEFLAKFPGWSNIILGAIAILVILFLPDGIMGTLQKKLHFEIFSQKRFSEPKRKKSIKEAANA
jgi:branched-chain amino acid transport system permease protein